jgi:hypothetical protein
MSWLKKIEKSLGEIIEISLLLIALGIVIEILFGDAVPFFGQVAVNLTELLKTLGEKGIVGLIAAGIIFFLFYRTIGLPVTNSNKGQVRTVRKGTGRRTKQARKT